MSSLLLYCYECSEAVYTVITCPLEGLMRYTPARMQQLRGQPGLP